MTRRSIPCTHIYFDNPNDELLVEPIGGAEIAISAGVGELSGTASVTAAPEEGVVGIRMRLPNPCATVTEGIATTLDSVKRVEHFASLGIKREDADSVASSIANHSRGGTLVHELNKHEIDSIERAYDLRLLIQNDDRFIVFYVKSLSVSDFIVITRDSLIQNIIHIQ